MNPKPWYASRTIWTSAAGMVVALGALLAAFDGAHATAIVAAAAALSALLGNIGSIFAHDTANHAIDAAREAQTAVEAHVDTEKETS